MGTHLYLMLILATSSTVFAVRVEDIPFYSKEFTVLNISDIAKAAGIIATCNTAAHVSPGSTVTFMSPNYPNAYPRKACQWLFYATEENAQIRIDCQTFDISAPFVGHCIQDSLFFYTTLSDVQSFCGNTKPSNVKSEIQWIYSFFRPSLFMAGGHTGFNCTATAVAPTTTPQPTTTTTTKPCECGRKGPPAGTRIVGGKDAGLHEYPWQAALVRKSDPSQVICGASVINDQFVLTAAHCIIDRIMVAQLQVAFGEHDRSITIETNETIYRGINLTIPHPSYNFGNFDPAFDNDIALVQLSEPIDLDASAAIKPICFPNSSNLYENVKSTTSGWGLLSTVGSQPNILQHVNITTLTNSDCQAKYGTSKTITANMICAMDILKDTCQGDSGGPLIVEDADHYVLVGLTSYKILCANSNFPGVYTRVGNYIDWINSNVGTVKTCMI